MSDHNFFFTTRNTNVFDTVCLLINPVVKNWCTVTTPCTPKDTLKQTVNVEMNHK